MHTPQTVLRSRAIYTFAAIGIITVGLVSRAYPLFPAVVGKYPGDTLWALMVFSAYCVLLPRSKTLMIAAIALATAYAVEFSQLYQAVPWFNSLRATTLGHLIFGSAFHWLDLVAYLIGILIGAILDAAWLAYSRKQVFASS